jgi:hypothetical protein
LYGLSKAGSDVWRLYFHKFQNHRAFMASTVDWMGDSSYNVGPPSYKLVYNPISYSYSYHKPWWNWSYSAQLSYRTGAPHCGNIALISPSWREGLRPVRNDLQRWSELRVAGVKLWGSCNVGRGL